MGREQAQRREGDEMTCWLDDIDMSDNYKQTQTHKLLTIYTLATISTTERKQPTA